MFELKPIINQGPRFFFYFVFFPELIHPKSTNSQFILKEKEKKLAC